MRKDKLSAMFVFLVFLSSLLFFSYNFADLDLWGHIKFGEEIVKSKSIPRYDFYSYTAYKYQWINHEWLSEALFYLICLFCGSAGLVIFKIFIGLSITFFLWKIIRARTSSPLESSAILFILCLSVITFGFAFRPQIFTYFFFTIFIYFFYLFRYENRNFILLSPLIMAVWTNLHGGFIAGIGLLFVYLIAELISFIPKIKSKFYEPLEKKKLKTLSLVFFFFLVYTYKSLFF